MKENHVSRRDFVKTLGVMGAGSIVGAGQSIAQANAPAAKPVLPAKVPTRPFGRTSARVSTLGLAGTFDTLTNQFLFKQSLDWGVTFWDTSGGATGGRSETGIGMYLEKNPAVRPDVFLATKYDGPAMTPELMTQGLEQSLARLKTDYVDMYFLHGLNDTKPLTDEMKAWVEKTKATKKIRSFGFSVHANMEPCLQAAAKLGWIDGIMVKYDFRLMQTDAMKSAVDAATKAGIGLIAMKTQSKSPVGAISDADLKLGSHFIQRGFSQEQAMLKAVWENPQIATICSKMPSTTILMANIAAALDKTSLSAADHAALREYAATTQSRHCAGCTQFCETALNHQVPVGDVMRCLMYHRSYGDHELARTVFGQLPETARRGLAGFDYAPAERACPHGLPIAQLMREAGELFAS
jgi:hypothetical protein